MKAMVFSPMTCVLPAEEREAAGPDRKKALMNSIERLNASADGEPLDCVPVIPGIGTYAAILAHEPMTKVTANPELMAKVILNSVERHGYDGCGPITDYGLGTESMGSVVEIGEWSQVRVIEFAVENETDLARLRIPDPMIDGRMPVIIGCEQILTESLDGQVGLQGGIAGPLSFAMNLRGLERMMADLVMRPTFIHDLTEISLEACFAFAKAQILRGGVGTIAVFDPVMTLISNSMADEFGFYYLERLFTRIKELDAQIMLHICGDTKRMIERMVEVGADILSLDIEVNLAEAKSMVNGRAVISGNVATQSLCCKDPDTIYQEACRCIEMAATGGRYTLSSSCEVPLETPPENIDAMVKAARKFGGSFLAQQPNAT